MDKVSSVQELIERTKEMPLEKMRFFINEDRKEPKCFGIYHDDAADRWVVYKNKADGSRAVRYSGPDEAHAANELWMKIQSEIGIRREKRRKTLTKEEKRRKKLLDLAIGLVTAAIVAVGIYIYVHTPDRGYYLVDDAVYYYQDSDWYWYDDGDWVYYDAPEGDWYADSYYGTIAPEYVEAGDAFEYSEYYVEPSDDDDDDSSIFDSWDSGDTDWDSDW